MSPYIEDQPAEADQVFEVADQVILALTTLTDLSSLSQSLTDENNSSGSESVHEAAPNVLGMLEGIQRHHVSLDFNLRELLTTVSGTEDLEAVTQIGLKVITRDVTLQQLGVYLPSLRNLVLDGSIISSLRDLGSGLKNLKVLSVNRCELSCIDGVFGFENLEEFYASDNNISDLTPCAFLTNIKKIDISRNSVKSLYGLSFLNLCPLLENVCFLGNLEFGEFPGYRSAIKRILPGLRVLDERILEDDLTAIEEVNNTSTNSDSFEDEPTSNNNQEIYRPNLRRASLPRNRPLSSTVLSNNHGFIVRFPPRVFTNRSYSNNNNRTI